MPSFYEMLNSISTGKILDVGTGRGQFLLTLHQHLANLGCAVGVDLLVFPEWESDRFKSLPFSFQQMDAERLQFTDNSFDLVAISESLHHLPYPEKVLSEMTRVLKPGGFFVFREVIADDRNPAQQTHTLIHQWCGKIDTAAGTYHGAPFTRAALIRLLEGCGNFNWQTWQEADLSADPFDPDVREEQEGLLNRYLKRTVDERLIKEADVLRRRMDQVGFLQATRLLAISVLS